MSPHSHQLRCLYGLITYGIPGVHESAAPGPAPVHFPLQGKQPRIVVKQPHDLAHVEFDMTDVRTEKVRSIANGKAPRRKIGESSRFAQCLVRFAKLSL